MRNNEAHAKPLAELVAVHQSDLLRGLTAQEAELRLRNSGPNELVEKPRPGFWARLRDQFNNTLVVLLIAAALVSLALGEYIDAAAILTIVALNALVGVIQETKAEQALAALQKMAAPHALVIRDGRRATVPGREIVCGDIVLLETGNQVPADLRLVESANLRIDESSLTGESVSAEKNAAVVPDRDAPIGDRKNAAFMGTVVSYGRGKGLVVATGMDTEIGLIAEMLQSFEHETTPLQKKLAGLGHVLGGACLAICALVFVCGLYRDTRFDQVLTGDLPGYLAAEKTVIVNLFMTAVSLAIAAVPEGLPAIVTVCLALGMRRMIKRNALVRKLPAVETLGCATVICTDKTGTLTQNEMTVVAAWAGGRQFRITGEGYAPSGAFFTGDKRVDPRADADAARLLQGALVCNDARLEKTTDAAGTPAWRIAGDPTEGAMVVAAAKAGFTGSEFGQRLPRLHEFPFDSERKRMSTIHRDGVAAPFAAFVKGAPDVLLALCSHQMVAGQFQPLTVELREAILAQNRAMAGEALRVLAVAWRPLQEIPDTA